MSCHNICNLRYKIPKEIPIVFYNVSTYDYHFIIKELAKEFDIQFECLRENTEKYITYSIAIKKELDDGKTITYKIKFIDSFRFMSTLLSSLVNNLSDGLYNDKCKDCKSCLDYMSVKDDQLIFRCLKCNKTYEKQFNKELINRFASTYEFCDKYINKFILLLRNGVCPYEFMDSWKRFDETSLPNNENFYSSLNMEGITEVDYRHAKQVLKIFNNKNIDEYHNLYVQSDTLLLADVFEKFKNKCIEINKLYPAHFLFVPGLAWQACLKKTELKLELLIDIDMLLMVEKGIRGGICYAIHRY